MPDIHNINFTSGFDKTIIIFFQITKDTVTLSSSILSNTANATFLHSLSKKCCNLNSIECNRVYQACRTY